MKRLKAGTYNAVVRILGIAVVLLAPAYIGWSSPDIDAEKSICPFMRFFDFPCPGCGLTKSMIHAYKGEFDVSFSYHVWGIPLIAMAIFLAVLQVYDLIMDSCHTDKILSKTLLWQVLAFLVV